MGAYGGPAAFPLYPTAVYASPAVGWVPLAVTFDTDSRYSCDEWTWYFGDGDNLSGREVTHQYDQVGVYDVTLALECEEYSGEINKEGLVVVLADTLKADSVRGEVGGTVEVEIGAVNAVPVSRLVIPVEYVADSHLNFLSWSTEGCRTEEFEITVLHMDTAYGSFALALEDLSGQQLEAGEGAVLKIQFSLSSSCQSGDIVPVTLGGCDGWLPYFKGPAAVYVVPTVSGQVTVGCCGQYTGGFTGNCNCSEDGLITLNDITAAIDNVYITKDELCCEESGNTNGSLDGLITLNDITTLIDHVYITKEPTAICLSLQLTGMRPGTFLGL
jgi:PKD repeat protein